VGQEEAEKIVISPAIEEVLEILYTCQFEQEDYPKSGIPSTTLAEAASLGLVELREGRYVLTASGQEGGRDVIRRHRLAERLLRDVLVVSGEHMEEDACRFEHVLQDELTDNVCTLLGHPSTCPHGKPIPEGQCCKKAHVDRLEEVSPICDGKPGDEGVVAYLATREYREVQKLMAMGILPGIDVKLIRRFPSYVFQLGYSQFTVDRSLAEVIYVRWKSKGGAEGQ